MKTAKTKIMLDYLEREASKYKDNIEYSKQYASECGNEQSKNWWIKEAEKNEHFLYVTNEYIKALKEIIEYC